jgi:hypothetical protein
MKFMLARVHSALDRHYLCHAPWHILFALSPRFVFGHENKVWAAA